MEKNIGGKILKVGDVVQLVPEGDHAFHACFMLVTKLLSDGAQGFIAMPQERGQLPPRAYFRAAWEQMEHVGHATWVPEDLDRGQNDADED